MKYLNVRGVKTGGIAILVAFAIGVAAPGCTAYQKLTGQEEISVEAESGRALIFAYRTLKETREMVGNLLDADLLSSEEGAKIAEDLREAQDKLDFVWMAYRVGRSLPDAPDRIAKAEQILRIVQALLPKPACIDSFPETYIAPVS